MAEDVLSFIQKALTILKHLLSSKSALLLCVFSFYFCRLGRCYTVEVNNCLLGLGKTCLKFTEIISMNFI